MTTTATATPDVSGVAVPVAAPVDHGRRPWRRALRIAAGVAVPLGVALLAIARRGEIVGGAVSLFQANPLWLLLALGLTLALSVAGTAAQLGAVELRPRLGTMFAVQVAAGTVNQVVPGNVGGMAVNVRFLERSGMKRSAAVAAVGLNSVAGLLTHIALALALWSFAPHVLTTGMSGGTGAAASVGLLPSGWPLADWMQGASAVAAVALAVLASAVSSSRGWGALAARLRAVGVRMTRRVAVEVRGLGAVVRRPGRAAMLWLGSAASPVLHSLILLAVGQALASGIGLVPVALAFLVASGVAAALPSPGGFGALDVTLTATLVAVGLPTATAIAVVLGYRLVTVWLPLMPGAAVLAVLLRRRVL